MKNARRTTKLLRKKRHLFKLSLFYDTENKVVHVGGGLENSPILILHKMQIFDLLIRETLSRNCHGRSQLTLFQLRQTVWINGELSIVKNFIYRCEPFIRQDSKILHHQVRDVSGGWRIPYFAFSKNGFDYCGHFNTKDSRGGSQKTYVALFICFSPKTVQIDTLQKLTKDNCLDTVKQITARLRMSKKYSQRQLTIFYWN